MIVTHVFIGSSFKIGHLILVDLFSDFFYLTPLYIFTAFAAITYSLTDRKWYHTLYLGTSLNYVYCSLYVYTVHPHFVGIMVATPFVMVFFFAIFHSLSKYGVHWDSYGRLWRDLLEDYSSYDHPEKPDYVSFGKIFANRPKLISILANDKLGYLDKLGQICIFFYFTCILIFLVAANLFFKRSSIFKVCLFLGCFSSHIILSLYDLGLITPVSLFDCMLYKVLSLYTSVILFFGVVVLVILTILILCFDKASWVKNFEAFYGTNVLSSLGYNNPYKSGAKKLIFLVFGSGIAGSAISNFVGVA